MGNQLNEGPTTSLLEGIAKDYQELRRDCRGTVLQQKDTQLTFLLREYSFGNESQYSSKLQSLQEEAKAGSREYVLSVVSAEGRAFASFCSTAYKIFALFEYPQVTLREEISARQKEGKRFEEGELWSILQSCSNALIDLRPVVTLHPADIFINPDGHLKAIHDDLADLNYRALLTPNVYYAPEKLKSFGRMDNELALKKQAIFSMGMTLLEAGLLRSVAECYDYDQGALDESQLAAMLEELNERYSPDFVEMLENLVDVNPNRRASLMEVQNMLENYWKNEGEEGQEEPQEDEGETDEQSEQMELSKKEVSNFKQEAASYKQTEKSEQKPSLTEKCMNKVVVSISGEKEKSRKDLTIPIQIDDFRLRQPTEPHEQPLPIQTPKNAYTAPRDSLYTDPKLLQMIKRDLQDINKLKQSSFFQTAKYTYKYPQTQSILDSIRNLEYASDAKPTTNDYRPSEFTHPPPFQEMRTSLSNREIPREEVGQFEPTQGNEVAAAKFMMKKKESREQLVYTIETYEDGRKYEGFTLNGKKHGSGKLTYDDGAYYEGEFKDDRMNGKGVLYYCQGKPAYDGQWLDDQFHGYGILYNECPVELTQGFDFQDFNEVEDYWLRYEGQFVLDNKSGRGRLLLSNGEWLEGEFQEDFVHGEAVFMQADGQQLAGRWEMNALVAVQAQ